MSRPRRLTESDWRTVFQLKCKSKRGETLSKQELALCMAALREDEDRYSDLEVDVFNATVPFESNVRIKQKRKDMRTSKNNKRIPQSYCSCGASPRGNAGHIAHRRMHQRRNDGHRPVTHEMYDRISTNPALRRDCDCGAGDQIGLHHRSQPPCPAYVRYHTTNAAEPIKENSHET